jgi:hypothetical protein
MRYPFEINSSSHSRGIALNERWKNMRSMIFLGLTAFILGTGGLPSANATDIHIPLRQTRSLFGAVDAMFFNVSYGDASTALFEDRRITVQSVGTTHTIKDLTDDSHYPAFVLSLTDGADETLYFAYRFEGSDSFSNNSPESVFFLKTDLKDSRVSSISLTVSKFTLDLTMTWVGFPLFFTDADFEGELTVSSTPGTVLVPLLEPLLLPDRSCD